MSILTISKAAKLAGVGVETIRFYERQGLIEQPLTPESGYRHYPPETVRKIRFILRAKNIGFSLHEIRDLLKLYFEPQIACQEVSDRAKAKIADMEIRITALENMKSTLQALVDECGKEEGACPILDVLGEESEEG